MDYADVLGIDCSTGETRTRPLTKEEIAERAGFAKAEAQEYKAAEKARANVDQMIDKAKTIDELKDALKAALK